MALGDLVQTHGYWLLALGCLLEGEAVVLLAGLAVQQGHLNFAGVVGVASVASFASDQFWFWLGRRHGPALFRRWPSLERRTARVRALIERFGPWVILGVRFAWGLRIAGPVLIGTTAIRAPLFAALNAVGALLWAACFTALGSAFGQAAESLLGDLRQFQGLLLGVLAAVALGFWWYRRRRG
ncbi:DedA family protein [Aquabacterium sp. J223]|uniref:DedA family protein n=1 Tax=Aquabacterium sp. J223 TaxID=2898431 RepID=UPI003916CDC3